MKPVQLALGAAGMLVLAVAAVGVYISLTPPNRPAGAEQARGGTPMRFHAEPKTLPGVAFEDGAGRKLSLAEFRGKLVLLNIWATWCTPCRKEMPALDRLQSQLGGPGFEVVALSIDRGGALAVKSFYEELEIKELRVYVDPTTRASSDLQAVGLPTTLLVDRHGREVMRKVGPAEWDSPEMVQVIRKYLQTAPRVRLDEADSKSS